MDEDVLILVDKLVEGFKEKGLEDLANFLRQRVIEIKEEMKKHSGLITSEQLSKKVAEELVHLLNVRFVQPYYAAALAMEFFREIRRKSTDLTLDSSSDAEIKVVIDKDLEGQ